jgi:hypothetical protein
VLEFALNKPGAWAEVQRVSSRLRRCARRPRAFSHILFSSVHAMPPELALGLRHADLRIAIDVPRSKALRTMVLGQNRPVGWLAELRKPHLTEVSIDDASNHELELIAACGSLKTLDVSLFGDVVVPVMSGVTELRLRGADPERFLASCPSLTALKVHCCPSIAGDIRRLRHLSLIHCGLTDLGPLAGATLLRTLDLSHNPVVGLDVLASMVELTSLDLSDTPVIAKSLAPLAKLGALRALSLDGCYGVTGACLATLNQLALTELGLSYCRRFRFGRRWRKYCDTASLRVLRVSNVPAAPYVPASVRELSVSETLVNDDWAHQLGCRLRSLHATYTKLTDAGFRAPAFAALESIVTTAALKWEHAPLPSLRFLELYRPDVDAEMTGIAKLPALCELRLRKSSVTLLGLSMLPETVRVTYAT